MDLSRETDVLSARDGDRDAFARLVTRYRGLVTSISLCTLGDVAASEDVAQEVFVAAWRALGSLRNPSSFLPWLRQLTRHRALDAVRDRRRADRPGSVDEDVIAWAVDPRPSAQDALLDDERTRAVRRALDALPAGAREVITLYYREGRSVEQVALLLGLGENTAKKRLSRARSALRDEVLARFAENVETTAPGEAFSSRVMIALPTTSPIAAAALVKGSLAAAGKWGLSAVTSGVAGMLPGISAAVWRLRRDLRGAMDARERRELRLAGLAELANYALFVVAIATLPPRSAGVAHTQLGIAYVLAFTAVHFLIFLVWLPRVRARRRRAELLADPSAAERHAHEDRQGRRLVGVASAFVLAVLVFAWLRR
jgi:RNA polymerase sigma factor (sigma-70 family)